MKIIHFILQNFTTVIGIFIYAFLGIGVGFFIAVDWRIGAGLVFVSIFIWLHSEYQNYLDKHADIVGIAD